MWEVDSAARDDAFDGNCFEAPWTVEGYSPKEFHPDRNWIGGGMSPCWKTCPNESSLRLLSGARKIARMDMWLKLVTHLTFRCSSNQTCLKFPRSPAEIHDTAHLAVSLIVSAPFDADVPRMDHNSSLASSLLRLPRGRERTGDRNGSATARRGPVAPVPSSRLPRAVRRS